MNAAGLTPVGAAGFTPVGAAGLTLVGAARRVVDVRCCAPACRTPPRHDAGAAPRSHRISTTDASAMELVTDKNRSLFSSDFSSLVSFKQTSNGNL